MTEADWLAATDPQQMLTFLRDIGRATDRKLRLFACACCRRLGVYLDGIGKEAVEVAEQYADGAASAEALRGAEDLAWWGADGLMYAEDHIQAAAWAAHAAVEGNAVRAANLAASGAGPEEQMVVLGPLVRDIFGNPFRPPPPLAPSVLGWNDGLVFRLAKVTYEDRQLPSCYLDPARLAVLADALLDAGCPADAEILQHLRGEGPHWRGCWTVDLLLNKE
jgi:hypothetical protein